MWMFMLFIIFWLAKRSKPKRVRFEDRSSSTNISIASELARIPDIGFVFFGYQRETTFYGNLTILVTPVRP